MGANMFLFSCLFLVAGLIFLGVSIALLSRSAVPPQEPFLEWKNDRPLSNPSVEAVSWSQHPTGEMQHKPSITLPLPSAKEAVYASHEVRNASADARGAAVSRVS